MSLHAPTRSVHSKITLQKHPKAAKLKPLENLSAIVNFSLPYEKIFINYYFPYKHHCLLSSSN